MLFCRCNTLLDASKSGRCLKAGIFETDQRKYWRENLIANPNHPDILSVLREAGQQKGKDLIIRYETALRGNQGSTGAPRDVQLLRPYEDEFSYALAVCEDAPRFNEDMVLIRKHVDIAYQMWNDACLRDRMRRSLSTPSPWAKKATQPQKKAAKGDIVLAATRAYAAPIEGIRMIRQLEQVKASYAFLLNENFGFSMAFQELCQIKAMSAPGGVVANLRMFDEAKSFAPAFMRTLTRSEEDYYS
jgi:hypothetical protein